MSTVSSQCRKEIASERQNWPLSSAPSPKRALRLLVSIIIATIAGVTCYLKSVATPEHPADFGVAWFGAKALLHGGNPYGLIGPGLVYDWPWRPLYPLPAMLIAMPFTLLPQLAAAVTFALISAGLLAYAVTADGWYRLPMFASASFLIAAAAAQWSPVLTAALAIPALAFVFAAKPSIGVGLFAAGSARVQQNAFVGGTILICLSLLILPSWPRDWIQNLGTGGTVPPLFRFGGVTCLLALLRWRRPEGRLIAALAIVPQTGSWYELLPLFLVASTASESMILCSLSGVGFVLQDYLMTARNEIEFNAQVSALMVATGYLPATIMVLRRPNEGCTPRLVGLVRGLFPGGVR